MALYDDPPLHDFPDRAIRRLLENPGNLRDLLAEVLPEVADHFDCARAELVNREFRLENWQKHELDLLFRIPFRTGTAEQGVLVCVLIEHQSQPDPVMPLRLLVYAVLHWQREWQTWAAAQRPGEALRLSPVVPIVFHTGSTPWSQRRGLADLFDMPPELAAFVPHWPLLYWDITDHSPQDLLNTARQWIQALAVVRAETVGTAEFAAIYKETLQRLEALSQNDAVRWKELLWFLLSWTLRRRPDEEKDDAQRLAAESQTRAATRREVELIMQQVKKTWEQSMLEQGELRGNRKTLRRQLEDRFGPLPESLIQRIETTADNERLETCLVQVLHIKSLDELAL